MALLKIIVVIIIVVIMIIITIIRIRYSRIFLIGAGPSHLPTLSEPGRSRISTRIKTRFPSLRFRAQDLRPLNPKPPPKSQQHDLGFGSEVPFRDPHDCLNRLRKTSNAISGVLASRISAIPFPHVHGIHSKMSPDLPKHREVSGTLGPKTKTLKL